MIPIRIGKPIRTEQEMFPLIESWPKSKLSQKEFGQKHNLPLHILPYWIRPYRKAHSLVDESVPAQTPVSFIQFTPPATFAMATSDSLNGYFTGWIDYNCIRRHSALGYESPSQFEEKYYQSPVSPASQVPH